MVIVVVSETPVHDVDQALRSVADTVLGLEFADLNWINSIEAQYDDSDERLRRLRDAYKEWDEMGRLRLEPVNSPDE